MATMETLLEFLKQVDAFEMRDCNARLLNNNQNKRIREFVEEVSAIANEVLFGSKGECLWDQHEILEEAGYHVFAGETDRFGWLMGCIQTKKGVIVYG